MTSWSRRRLIVLATWMRLQTGGLIRVRVTFNWWIEAGPRGGIAAYPPSQITTPAIRSGCLGIVPPATLRQSHQRDYRRPTPYQSPATGAWSIGPGALFGYRRPCVEAHGRWSGTV